MTKEQILKRLAQIPGWQSDSGFRKIGQEFELKDFIQAVRFVNKIAEIAESENHHPDIHIFYNRVKIELWTHSLDGLSEKDFILAAKISYAFKIFG